jgi:WD40 repeat protein
VSALAVAPDGRHVLSASHDCTLKLWDLSTGRLLSDAAEPAAAVSAVAVTPDGRHALSASHDRTLRLWDLATGQLLRTFTGHERTVTAVAVTPDGHLAVSGSTNRTLRFWDIGEECAEHWRCWRVRPWPLPWRRTAGPSWSEIESATFITSRSTGCDCVLGTVSGRRCACRLLSIQTDSSGTDYPGR